MCAAIPSAGRARTLVASDWLPEATDADDPPPEPSDLPADDDSNWEVFIPDDDQRDPLPDPADFWFPDDSY